ncbi:MAG: DUF1588 domain-containing protein [Myxococcota bacterium]
MRRRLRAIGCAFLVGCTGTIGDVTELEPPVVPDGPTRGEDGLPDYRHSPGVRVLTQREYRNAVADLLGVELARTEAPAEQVVAGHGQIALAQAVGYDEVDSFYELGVQAAEEAVATLDAGCDFADIACAREWSGGFLERAFRGAPTDRYAGILEDADAGETVEERLETLIAAALSSPHFLYRREVGEGGTNRGTRRLSGEEIASRLSFLVWQSGPDAELRAADLRDPSVRLAQLTRLLDDPRARIGMHGFVYDWMGLSEGGVASKDPEVLAGTPASLAASAEMSFDLLLDRVLFEEEGTFPALLTTEEYVVDTAVGALVGVDDATESFASAAINSAERRGVLMHPMVLAAHTKESGASPFPLGKFINEHLLCEVIDPPAMIPEVDEEEIEGETFRERMEARTAAPACQSCHRRIGPPGFAFLSFDPVGRYQAEDGLGRPFDTSGVLPAGDDMIVFENASEMAQGLAAHPSTARCVARRMFRWTFGHFEHEDDQELVDTLEEVAVAEDGAMRPLLDALVASEAFTRVRVEP